MDCVPRHSEEGEHRITHGVSDSRLGSAGVFHSKKDP